MAETWLSQLKPGDEVAVEGRTMGTPARRIAKVLKITGSGLIDVTPAYGEKPDRFNARGVRRIDSWYCQTLRELTPELRQQIEDERLRYGLASRFEKFLDKHGHSLRSLPADVLRRLVAIANEVEFPEEVGRG